MQPGMLEVCRGQVRSGQWRKKRKETTGKPRRKCVEKIKIYLRETGRGRMYWMDLAQDRDQWRALVNTVMNLQVP
jgi:hypothetical protein